MPGIAVCLTEPGAVVGIQPHLLNPSQRAVDPPEVVEPQLTVIVDEGEPACVNEICAEPELAQKKDVEIAVVSELVSVSSVTLRLVGCVVGLYEMICPSALEVKEAAPK